MKSLLIITYYFPPMRDIGGFRLHGFAKYLPLYKWNPIILTPILPNESNPKFRIIQTGYEDVVERWKRRIGLNPEKTLNAQCNISRKKNCLSVVDRIAFLPYEIISYPDDKIGWYDFAVSAGKKILETEQIDAILSSSFPITCHLIAKTLTEYSKIPWIADFRDLWTQNPYVHHTRIRNFFERRLELTTLEKASCIVTVSEPLAEDLRKLHKNKPIYCITNGFDEDDTIFPQPEMTQKFSITYTGLLYDGKRDPAMLFEALNNLINKKSIDSNLVDIRFFGSSDSWLFDEIKKFHLEKVVTVHGSVSHENSLKAQRESQILLLLLWNNPQECGVYTGKLFEYLTAQRFILAIGGPQESVIKKLFEETNAGYYTGSIHEIEKIIEQTYKEFNKLGVVPFKGQKDEISKYNQHEMARKMADLLNKVTK